MDTGNISRHRGGRRKSRRVPKTKIGRAFGSTFHDFDFNLTNHPTCIIDAMRLALVLLLGNLRTQKSYLAFLNEEQ